MNDVTCRVCGELIEEYPDAISGGWTHVDIALELTADHSAVPTPDGDGGAA